MSAAAVDRAQRPVIVAPSLSGLNGPDGGLVELPLHLDWTPANTYDLSVPKRVATMYRTILQEAKSANDLAFINGRKLLEVWGSLRLPRSIRAAWELSFPELANAH